MSVPPPDTEEFPAVIMMLQGLSQHHPGDFNTIVTFLSHWVEQGTVLPAFADFPPLDTYRASLSIAVNALVDAFIAHPLPHLAILLTHIAILHSLHAIRYARARDALGGAPEPGVDLILYTREDMVPILRTLEFLSTRARQPAYLSHQETIAIFAVTVGVGLAYINAMVPALTPFAFYQSVGTPDSVYLVRILYACIEHDVPAALASLPPHAVLSNAEMMLPAIHAAREQLSWLSLLKQSGRISPTHCNLTVIELAALRAPASLNVEVTARCWREGCTSPPSLDVKRCGRCKRVYYCGTACRNADWSAGHRAICGTLTNLRIIYEHPGMHALLQAQIAVVA